MRYGAVFAPRTLRAPGLPPARGPLSAWVVDHLARPVHTVGKPPLAADDPLYGDDAALALYVLYELHYRSFAGVDDAWEWEPSLLAARQRLEHRFLRRLQEEVPAFPVTDDVPGQLVALISGNGGPSLSAYMAEEGTLDQLREFAVHRSAYQLKEADPHTWAIPRLYGAAKAALVEIQADEYGAGRERDMHQTLFGLTMHELGLDASYGAYLDVLPGTTLATTNLVSFFGLHRRWRGALVGHLAIFEMTSVEPMGRYSVALRRHGFGSAARHFYEVHVVADAHHQKVAAYEMAGPLVQAEPELAHDVMFGAWAVTTVEARFSRAMREAWERGESSLRQPLTAVDLGVA
jgi:Iron-containing redox enzyme